MNAVRGRAVRHSFTVRSVRSGWGQAQDEYGEWVAQGCGVIGKVEALALVGVLGRGVPR